MGLPLPRITKCCFCVPLRTASLLIGYFSILTSCLILAVISFYTYKVVTYVDDLADHPDPHHSPEEVKGIALNLYISLGYYMVVFVYNIVINLLLVIGVHKNKPKYLKLYINTAYFLLVLAIVLIVLTCVFMGLVATIPILKWAFILLVCIIVVRSTYMDMEERNKPRIIEMQDLFMPQQAPLIL